ncbi:MAG: hypothetical protein M3N95_11440 [Actinomycetota bacterium]|nr:hypothetical protein [Actinomycetota bacterium]
MMPLTLSRTHAGPAPEPDFRLSADSITLVVREQWMPLVRLATLLLSDRAVAEEVVQQACEAVWRRQPELDSSAALISYLRERRERRPVHRAARRDGRSPSFADPVRTRTSGGRRAAAARGPALDPQRAVRAARPPTRGTRPPPTTRSLLCART